MGKKVSSHTRINPETKRVINNLSFQLSQIERRRITSQEILRRTFNHPNLQTVLKKDAELKRRIRDDKI